MKRISKPVCHEEGKNYVEYRLREGVICQKCKGLSTRFTVNVAGPQEEDMPGETYLLIVYVHTNDQDQVVDSHMLRVSVPHALRPLRPDTGVNSHLLHKVAQRVLDGCKPPHPRGADRRS